MAIEERLDSPNLFSQVNTWILCGIFLVFASLYGFSFERGSLNSLAAQAGSGIVDSNPDTSIVTAQNIATYLLSVLCIFPLMKPVWREIQQNLLILSILGWLFLSVMWSGNPQQSLVNAGRMTIDLVLVFYLFERYSENDIQKLVLIVGYIAAAGSLLMVFVFPQYGLQSRGELNALGSWEGIFGQKNICGQAMMLLLLPAFFVKIRGLGAKVLLGGYAATVLVIIAMTRSAEAWIFSIACLVIVVLLKLIARMSRKDAAVLVVGVAMATLTLGATLVANFDTVAYALGKDPTMTGRTKIWSVLLGSILKRPFCGYGYVAFWQWRLTGESANFSLQTRLTGYSSADSGVVELALELGAVGILLYGIVFLRAVKDACYCIGREASPAALWYTSMLVYVATSNLGGGALLRPSDLACILPFVAYIGLKREANRLRQAAAAETLEMFPHPTIAVCMLTPLPDQNA